MTLRNVSGFPTHKCCFMKQLVFNTDFSHLAIMNLDMTGQSLLN